ncbi:MAG: MBL fold metallo-hydrolase [Gammaproteobacteria bacterium]|nr:MBL fold metallo-hydrolase [Gammaproteobacteria bacterium]
MAMADGITWLRMPLPMSLNHINLWLLRDSGGWVIVDTGVDIPASRDVWRSTFATAMRNEPATHVIATHLHPDHAGCAGWLVREFDVDLWMTREEYMLCRVLAGDTRDNVPEEAIRFYREAGFNDAQLALYRKNFGLFGKVVGELPKSYRRMRDGERLTFAGQVWEVVVGRGHSPEHACLYDRDRNILISGDQILPTISPNVSVWPTEPLADPLREWFESIDKLEKALPEDVLVLPAHGKPFRGAHVRLEQLRKEHTDNLDKLLERLREPLRAVDVFDALFNSSINDGNRVMATGEALSHLTYLRNTGDLLAEKDPQGVTWFRRT